MNSSVAVHCANEAAAEVRTASAGIDALFVMASLHVGGTERKIVRVTNQLVSLGRQTAIAYLSGPETLLDMLNPAVGRRPLQRQGRFSIGAVRRLAAMINELRPRVVVSVNLYPAMYVLAARALCDYTPKIAALVNIIDMGPERRAQQRFYQQLLPRFDLVVYGCRAQRDAWVRRESSAWNRSTVLYNGVNLAEFTNQLPSAEVAAIRMKYGLGQQAFVIGTLGRLYRPKNQRVLIDAVARLRSDGVDARVILAGDGPDRDYLQQHAARLKVAEFVVMTGNITDVRPVLAAMDVFVLPSDTETFSNAALEAMAMRRPVVLSDVGGAREMIRPGIDGHLIPHAELQERLPLVLKELAQDRARRAALGKAARERVEADFSFDGMIHRYDQIVATGRAQPREPESAHIVQVGPGLSVRGGISTVEQLIADHLAPHMDVDHVSSMEDGSAWLKVRVFLRAIRSLRSVLASKQPLVVHMHFASRGSTLRKSVLAWMTLRARRPLVLHAHGASFDEFFLKLPRSLQRLLSRLFARADRFIVLSSQWRDFYVRQCGLPEERIALMVNPTSLPATVPDRRQRQSVQFVSVGRIGARKGSFDLVRAFRALPLEVRERARLVFAGDGQVEELRAEARDLAGQVTVHSWLDRQQLAELLDASDVFVLPSYSEGVPMALLEAMAHGLPSIVTPVGGIPDAMTANAEGVFVGPGDHDALSAALRRMIEDESQRLVFGRAARARAEQFDVAHYTQQLLQLYRQLLGQSAGIRSP